MCSGSTTRQGRSPVPVSPETMEALTTARQISEWTSGKFDVTFGALSDVWKFDQDQDDSLPSASAIAARRRPHRLPQAAPRRAHAAPPFCERKGMRVHLGGIGKGSPSIVRWRCCARPG